MPSCLSGAGDWESTVKPAATRIRAALVMLNVVLLITGIILIILGVHLNYYVIMTSGQTDLPPIWLIGALPLSLGLIGITCVLLKRRKWVMFWIITCGALSVISFISFVLLQFLDPRKYGINIQIFGNCLEDGTNCKCLWEENPRAVGVLTSPCHVIRHTSTVYLSLVFVFVVCLAVIIVANILGCVLTTCLKMCAHQDDMAKETHTTIYRGTSSRMVNTRTKLQETHLSNNEYFLVATDDNLETTRDDSTTAMVHRNQVTKECNYNIPSIDVATTSRDNQRMLPLSSSLDCTHQKTESAPHDLVNHAARSASCDSMTKCAVSYTLLNQHKFNITLDKENDILLNDICNIEKPTLIKDIIPLSVFSRSCDSLDRDLRSSLCLSSQQARKLTQSDPNTLKKSNTLDGLDCNNIEQFVSETTDSISSSNSCSQVCINSSPESNELT